MAVREQFVDLGITEYGTESLHLLYQITEAEEEENHQHGHIDPACIRQIMLDLGMQTFIATRDCYQIERLKKECFWFGRILCDPQGSTSTLEGTCPVGQVNFDFYLPDT